MKKQIQPGDTVYYSFEQGGETVAGKAKVQSEIHLDGPWFENEEGVPYSGYNLDSNELGTITVHESNVEPEDKPFWKFW